MAKLVKMFSYINENFCIIYGIILIIVLVKMFSYINENFCIIYGIILIIVL